MDVLRTPAAKVKEFWLTVTPCEDREFNVTSTDQPDQPVTCPACGRGWTLTLVWEPDERQWYAEWTPTDPAADRQGPDGQVTRRRT